MNIQCRAFIKWYTLNLVKRTTALMHTAFVGFGALFRNVFAPMEAGIKLSKVPTSQTYIPFSTFK